MADHGLGAQAHRVGAGEVRRGIGLDVEQVGDAERRPSAGSSESQLRGDPSGPPLAGGCGVHGVLDDPHRDRRPRRSCGPGSTARGSCRRRAPRSGSARRTAKDAEARHRMCAPVASTSRAREWDWKLRSASTSIPGPNAASRSRAKVCFTERAGPEGGPDQRPGPRLRRGEPADLQKRPGPGRVRGSAEVRGVLRGVRHVAGGAVHRHHPQPAAEHPRGADRACTGVEGHRHPACRGTINLAGRGRGRGRAWRAVVTADRTLSLQLGWLPPALAG